jgi:hypothetical protein
MLTEEEVEIEAETEEENFWIKIAGDNSEGSEDSIIDRIEDEKKLE